MNLMELFYIPNFIPGQPTLNLPAEESHHARKVLRKRKGDILRLTDGLGSDITAIILDDKEPQLELLIQQQERIPFPPENLIEVALSVIRPNRMDWAIEKLTELGVQTIVPIHCQYTNYRSIKIEHLRKIAISAMKQSGQLYLPDIKPDLDFKKWLTDTAQYPGSKFLAHPHREPAEKIIGAKPDEKFLLAIGPEGGFHPDELSLARQAGFQLLPLGQTILRTETAAVSGVIHLKIRKSQVLLAR
jgi:16S rRNA (uracil1498-N3)-methyltransferase